MGTGVCIERKRFKHDCQVHEVGQGDRRKPSDIVPLKLEILE